MKNTTCLIVFIFSLFIILPSCKKGSSDNIIVLTTANFAEETGKGIVMVDFWATWCMPCKAMAPVIDEMAAQTKGKVIVGKVDVDANGELANKFGIQAIPTIIIFKDGQQVETLVGMQSKASLVNALSKYVTLE
jgi:thioredoxin 1